MGIASAAVDLSGNKGRQRRERIIKTIFLAAGISSLVISFAIILSLVGKSYEFLSNIGLETLWTNPHQWAPRIGKFDLATLFIGSLLVTAVAMVIATPLGLGAAIYLAEYASPRVRRILKPILEILAGIPSIVIAFFAIQWIGPDIVQRISSEADAFSLCAAGIGVGLLVTPLVASVSEDAMRAVPHSLREASYGMGAKQMTTVLRVVFPAAISGIVAALMLAASRAIGETMVVALAAGAAGDAKLTTDVFDVGTTVTAAMASLAVGTDQVATGSGEGASQAVNSLFFLGFLLFLVTFLLNMVGDLFVRRIENRY